MGTLRSLLNLRNLTISRVNETTDGMGGIVTTTTTATLGYAAIWQTGSNNPYISERIAHESTHMLAFEPQAFTFDVKDAMVTSGGRTFKIIGDVDNVMNKDVLALLPLKVIT